MRWPFSLGPTLAKRTETRSSAGMTKELHIRIEGRAGRITLTRPQALNALSGAMIGHMLCALHDWAHDDRIHLILLDAEGDRAFCAGGDLRALYQAGQAGDLSAGRQFWSAEYRLNLALATSPKPVVSFMQGLVMGGGIGLGCHAALRLADPAAQFAVSQTRIGLAPDAGASFLLSLAPGRMGEYLGATGRRFSAADACWLGFADRMIDTAEWPAIIATLCKTGDLAEVPAPPVADAPLARMLPWVNSHFGGEGLGDIWRALMQDDTPFATEARACLTEVSPLAAAAAVELMHRLGDGLPMPHALEMEYRFAHRAMAEGDVLEGIRARIIDRDQAPRWHHDGPEAVPAVDLARMLRPLGADGWSP